MTPSALRAPSGWVSMTRLAAPAWIATTPMLCATMSCSSRAIRSRSAVTACSATRVRICSVLSRSWRREFPTTQATTTIIRTTASTEVPTRSPTANRVPM
ncbi:hypothetical protein P3T36_001922 [Kitasatospora sp. MAP12-15]|nr:hypothetical protein [Kitasatospora sp. MAP12-44]